MRFRKFIIQTLYLIFVVEIDLVFNSHWGQVEEYEMEFLEEEEGDEFLEEAIICPVPGCLNKGHIFKKYNIYVTHYTGS